MNTKLEKENEPKFNRLQYFIEFSSHKSRLNFFFPLIFSHQILRFFRQLNSAKKGA
jgi:hypothetical protein